MNNENLLPEDNEIPDYLTLTLQMLEPYKKEETKMFVDWLDLFECLVSIIEVPNDKIIKIFNSMIDNEIHKAVKIFHYPVNLSKLSYDLLINHYLYYFYRMEPQDIHINRFTNRNQYEMEPLEIYANNLQKMFEKCIFTDEKIHILIRKFIEGIKDDKIKRNIKNKFFLSFNETVDEIILYAKSFRKYFCECNINPAFDIYIHGISGLFCEWFNEFEYVADVHEISKYHMLEKFIDLIDDNIHKNVKNYYRNINLKKCSYEETVKIYLRYFDFTDEPNVHRKRFLSRLQYKDESIEGYAERLQKIYKKCDYKDDLEEKLIEQFVRGIRDDEIRDYFLLCVTPNFTDVLSFAIKCEKSAATIDYEIPNLSIIDFYNPENEGTFWDWLNEFQYKVKTLKLGDLAVLEIFNKKIHNDVHENVKKANPDIDLSEILYEDTIALYLRYFASSDETDVYKKLFLCRNQYEEETCLEYRQNLFDIFQNCNCTGNRDQILIERYINGLYDNELKSILKKFPPSKYGRIFNISDFLENFKYITRHLNFELSRIPTFHPMNGEEFYVWLNKFEYVVITIEITSCELVDYFNKMVDDEIHELVKNENSDLNFSELEYAELINCYLRYFAYADETNLHRKRFLCRNQYKQETIANYSTMLCSLYFKCNSFDRSSERLCERFREGLVDDKLKNYLKKSRGLSLNVLLAKALAFANETC